MSVLTAIIVIIQNACKIKILYWNCQGLGSRRSELLQLTNQIKIDVLLQNETHLSPRRPFKLPNFHTLKNDRISPTGVTNCGGTAILIHHKFAHNELHIQTNSIETTTITIMLNNRETRLSAVYKSPSAILLQLDLDNLLNSDSPTILAGDLNAKHLAWHRHCPNSAGNILLKHMENNNYNVTALEFPTHYPDQRNHRSDVLDVAVLKNIDLPFILQNRDELSTDHNLVVIYISSLPTTSHLPGPKILTNWAKFSISLHNSVTDANISLPTPSVIDQSIKTLTEVFQVAIAENTTILPDETPNHLPKEIND